LRADDLTALGIDGLSRAYSEGRLSPVEVAEAYLARIEELDKKINSYITVAKGQALAAARLAEKEIERGNHRGPLHGVPFAAKDIFASVGIRTTNGSKLFWGYVPDFDATAIARMKSAGGVMLGKLHLHEFAYRSPNFELIGACNNPWNLEHTTGGSSSGSAAAVSASLCAASLGTDTGGSIRTPASFCGVVGLKPSIGRVGRYGVTPLSFTLDAIGPLTRTVKDTAMVLRVLAGRDERDPGSSSKSVPDYAASLDGGVEGVRVGVPKDYFFEGCDEEVEAAVRRAVRVLAATGCAITEVSLGWADRARAVSRTITMCEAAYHHRRLLKERPQDYGPAVGALASGLLVTAVQYITALREREALLRKTRELFGKIDVLVTPTTPTAAPTTKQRFGTLSPKTSIYTGPINPLGGPALSLPCGFTKGGLPIGLQIIARPFDETTVLRVAHAYEEKTKWHRRSPPV
jgi:aspartyl-tRNA(Asn)/glutamyl-tRNA(Gln) amidotransferase subunit A